MLSKDHPLRPLVTQTMFVHILALLAVGFADPRERAVLVWWAAGYAAAAVVLTHGHRRRLDRTAAL